MNNHKTACLILIVFVAGMLYGVNQLRNASDAARDKANAAQTNAENAEQQAQLAQIQLKTLEAKTAQLRQVAKSWQPHFERFRSNQDAEQGIAEVIREADVFVVSQKFDPRQLDKDAMISDAVIADLVVEDDYIKTINWLGTLEQKIPNSRISKCILKRGDRGNNIHLELQVQIPVLK